MALNRWRILLLVAATLVGCDGSQPGAGEETTVTAPRRGGVFRIAQDPPGMLDPARLDDSYEASIVNQLFDGLLAPDTNLNPIPALANSWTISRDGLVYTFQLRKGVRFHDGSECTSEDVVYSLSRVFRLDPLRSVLSREYLSPIEGSQEYADGLSDRIRGLEALGSHEVRITLSKPHAAFLSVLASEFSRVVPKHYVQSVGDEEFSLNPIGTGPFRFERWHRGRHIILSRFEDYYAEAALLDSVVFELPEVGHRDYASDQFFLGHMSAIEVQANTQSALDGIEGIQILSRQELSLAYMALNLAKPPFDDPRVRRAVMLAIDRDAIAAQHATGRYVPRGILPPGMPGFDPTDKLPPHDPEQARALLEEAGYDDFHPMPPIIHASANESASEKDIHAELRRQLSEIGIQLHSVYLNWLDFDARIRRGDFHAFTLIWVADLPDPDSFLSPLFLSSGSNNLYHYENPTVDELLKKTYGMRSASERWELHRAAERVVVADCPIIPLYHNVATIALQPQVRGFTLTPLGIGSMKLETVWLDEADLFVQVAR